MTARRSERYRRMVIRRSALRPAILDRPPLIKPKWRNAPFGRILAFGDKADIGRTCRSLLSYGVDDVHLMRRAAPHVGRILKGEKAAKTEPCPPNKSMKSWLMADPSGWDLILTL